MDNLLSLRVFAAVAEGLSFINAAERLGLSTAMTSKHVQHLERRLGARLLNRTSRSVSLTEAGAAYLARIRPLIEGLDEAEAQISQTTLRPRGVLKISAPVWMANPGFARILAEYREANPQVVLDVELSGRKANLVEEGIDLAIRVTFALEEGLVARRIADVAFLLVASPELLKKLRSPASLEDIAGAPFLAYAPVAGDGVVRFEAGGKRHEIRLSPVLLSANETLLLHAARQGAGVAIMPQPLVSDDLAAGSLVEIFPEMAKPMAPMHAVYPDRSYLPAKTRRFLDHLAGPRGLPSLVDARPGRQT